MEVFLVTENHPDGTIEGAMPTIQDKEYWIKRGYEYILHRTDGAITLCKWNLGEIGEHARYPRMGIFRINKASH
jgi:hypothetical protein